MFLRQLRGSLRLIGVRSEGTPNPEALIFFLEKGKPVLGDEFKSIQFTDKYACASSPLAQALFKIQGVSSVLLAAKHVTINKQPEMSWNLMRPNVELVISQYFETGMPPVRESALERVSAAAQQEHTELETKIRGLLDERVRPFVQQDGGDLEFVSFDESSGFVTVKMQGACQGCPKSAVTLKMGIERMLKHYVPEISGVINLTDEDPPKDD